MGVGKLLFANRGKAGDGRRGDEMTMNDNGNAGSKQVLPAMHQALEF